MSDVSTKYAILNGYKLAGSPNRIRDTWVNLGQIMATGNTRTFVKDMLYFLDLSASGVPYPAFHGAIVLCEESLYSADYLNWGQATLEETDQGLFSFMMGIITPHFRLMLSADELAAITIPLDSAFIPYTEVNTAEVIISDSELELILSEAGVPFFSLDELEYPKSKIINNMIKPALQQYFKWFPYTKIQQVVSASILSGTKFEVLMPDGAYGATRVSVIQGMQVANGPGSPLAFYASEILSPAGQGAGFSTGPGVNSLRGPGFANLQGFATGALDRAARQGIMNYASRLHFHIERREDGKKYLVTHSNKTGVIEIYWAYYSNNWDHVEFERLDEVRNLATAKVLRNLGMLRQLVKSDVNGAIDYSLYLNRAKELEDKVLAFWENIPQAIVIRG